MEYIEIAITTENREKLRAATTSHNDHLYRDDLTALRCTEREFAAILLALAIKGWSEHNEPSRDPPRPPHIL